MSHSYDQIFGRTTPVFLVAPTFAFHDRDDTRAEAEQIARKLAAVRLWEDEAGRRWARSAADLDYEILCVSQFTLYHTMKGNKPDFRQAMAGTESSQLYQAQEGTLPSIIF